MTGKRLGIIFLSLLLLTGDMAVGAALYFPENEGHNTWQKARAYDNPNFGVVLHKINNVWLAVTNGGNAKIYPKIEVEGPGVLQSITNYTTGKEIQFDGLTLQTGEIITLDLDPTDIKYTSTWKDRGRLLKYINPGSDTGQFYLKPGTNYISLFMPSGTDANTQAFIYYTPKFWNLEGSRYE